MAEQFALEEAFGISPAVDGDDRKISPVAAAVNGPGNEFLPRAALAPDHHRRIGFGHGGHPLHDLFQGLALPDEFIGRRDFLYLSTQPQVLREQPSVIDGVSDEMAHVIGVYRLDDVVEGPFLQCLNACLDGRKGGDHDGHHVFVDLLDPPLELQSVHTRHLDVQEDDVPGLLLKFFQRGDGIFGRIDPIAVELEPFAKGFPYRDFIVHNEYRRIFRFHPVSPLQRQGRGGGLLPRQRDREQGPRPRL